MAKGSARPGDQQGQPAKGNVMDRRLLQPGWAGLLSLAEAEFIADALAEDAGLRRRWGFGQRKRYPLALIAEKAFPEDPKAARTHIINQQHAGRHQERARNEEKYPGEYPQKKRQAPRHEQHDEGSGSFSVASPEGQELPGQGAGGRPGPVPGHHPGRRGGAVGNTAWGTGTRERARNEEKYPGEYPQKKRQTRRHVEHDEGSGRFSVASPEGEMPPGEGR
jgi:hypothetical protein